jgi:hypothetical protein
MDAIWIYVATAVIACIAIVLQRRYGGWHRKPR